MWPLNNNYLSPLCALSQVVVNVVQLLELATPSWILLSIKLVAGSLLPPILITKTILHDAY